jgi:hypothetical protein
VLADAAVDESVERLALVIEHFWEARHFAGTLLDGASRSLMIRVLSEAIEERLTRAARTRAHRVKPVVPLPLVAVGIAQAQWGLIGAWLTKAGQCSPEAMTAAISLSTRALARSLAGGERLR